MKLFDRDTVKKCYHTKPVWGCNGCIIKRDSIQYKPKGNLDESLNDIKRECKALQYIVDKENIPDKLSSVIYDTLDKIEISLQHINSKLKR